MLQKTTVKAELQKLSEKDRKKREGKKQRYLDELEKLGLSDITKYKLRFKKIKYENGDIDLEFKVIPDPDADPVTCATAAIQEISQGKYGLKIKTHGKESALLKLIEREEKLEEWANSGENKDDDGFIEALSETAQQVWIDEEE